MTIKKAIEKGFTYSGYMFEYIPVYFKLEDDDGFSAVGKNFIYDILLEIFTTLDSFTGHNKSFEVWMDEKDLNEQINKQ